MDPMGAMPYNDRNDKNNETPSREMQYLVPPTPNHIVITAPEQTPSNGPIPDHSIPRNLSTGTIQELQLHRQLSRVGSSTDLVPSRRPSAIVTAMQRRPSMPRSILMEYVQPYQSVLSSQYQLNFNFGFQFAEWTNAGWQ